MPACVSTAPAIPLLVRPNGYRSESDQLLQMICGLRESKLLDARVERSRGQSERAYVDLTVLGTVFFSVSLTACKCSLNYRLDSGILRVPSCIKRAVKCGPRVNCRAYLAAGL